ncbi:hypothetical protein [Haloferula sp.]|uniref:hypothetical protein n=1 Tax=Haloferula sp. TaxID=2497595 RepID=UPI003C71149E
MRLALPLILLASTGLSQIVVPENSRWNEVESKGDPCKRHEHAFVAVENQFLALGGRRIQAVDIYDPQSTAWTKGQEPPIELHHFQALSHQGKVLVAGAFTGKFPAETPVDRLYYYDPSSDRWSEGPEIPADRRRGSVTRGGTETDTMLRIPVAELEDR